MAPLTEDHIDDILYLARIGDLTDLLTLLSELRQAGITATPSGGTTDEEYLLAARDAEGNTAMHMAAANGHTEVITHFLPAPPTTTTTTTTTTATTTTTTTQPPPPPPPHPLTTPQNAAGNTPLHWACVNGHLSAVKALIDHGHADATVQNRAGRDPVFEAELAEHEAVADWLLRSCGELEVAVGGGAVEGDVGGKEEEEGEGKGKGKGKEGGEEKVVEEVGRKVEGLEVR